MSSVLVMLLAATGAVAWLFLATVAVVALLMMLLDSKFGRRHVDWDLKLDEQFRGRWFGWSKGSETTHRVVFVSVPGRLSAVWFVLEGKARWAAVIDEAARVEAEAVAV